jgi:hypothetical protein
LLSRHSAQREIAGQVDGALQYGVHGHRDGRQQGQRKFRLRLDPKDLFRVVAASRPVSWVYKSQDAILRFGKLISSPAICDDQIARTRILGHRFQCVQRSAGIVSGDGPLNLMLREALVRGGRRDQLQRELSPEQKVTRDHLEF